MFKQTGDTILLVEDEEAAILLVQQAVASCPVNCIWRSFQTA